MQVTHVRAARPQLHALQLTNFACAAAAVVDAVAAIEDWTHQLNVRMRLHGAQLDLIRRLDLDRSGTSFERLAVHAHELFPRFVFQRCRLELEAAVRFVTSGPVGVILGLDSDPGSLGHAVRLVAGDVPNYGAFDELPADLRAQIFNRPGLETLTKLQVFDPWFEPQSRLEAFVETALIRRRFEPGNEVLLISSRQ